MKKWSKLLIAVLLVVCVISPIFTTASCEINDKYDPSIVDNSYYGRDINDDFLIQMLAKFVYSVASWAENTIGNLLAMLTGTSDFPWADKIVFNSVPVLDVNFLNPATNSYMAIASEFIQKIYWTMFTIALSLFGVLVLITAIKLAISTIASDKAKYKQALTSWVLGFVMLWTIHFLMAFLFYLNEQLVIEASNMADASFDMPNQQLTELQKQELKAAKEQITGDFTNYITGENISKPRFNSLFRKYQAAYNYLYFTTLTNGTQKFGLYDELAEPYINGIRTSENPAKLRIQRLTSILDCLDKDTNKLSIYLDDIDNSLTYSFYVSKKGFWDNFLNEADASILVKFPETEFLKKMLLDPYESPSSMWEHNGTFFKKDNASGVWRFVELVEPDEITEIMLGKVVIDVKGGKADYFWWIDKNTGLPSTSTNNQETQQNELKRYDVPMKVFFYSVGSTKDPEDMEYAGLSVLLADLKHIIHVVNDGKNYSSDVSYVTNLSRYFKINASKIRIDESGKKVEGEAIVSNQIMYAILVVQSIMLFIAYVKRLFFVLLLSMMAPLVVVVDFFQKFGK